MAQSDLIYPLDSLHGKISKKSKTVFRRKAVYDENGNVIAQYAQESYVVEHPRDWKKNPPKGAEKQRLDNWTTACQRAKAELRDEALAAQWRQRFEAQLKHGEADAPMDPKTHKPKIYSRFDCFVRAAIFRSLTK
ncbi:MAG: hypothetical protein J6R79_03090 [Bacteroidaceae bacterium]|nr:hypothetical protein [Bacteroidaceae bacterium]